MRVGLIGTGFAAAAHADALRRVPGVTLSGIVGSTPARGRDAASTFGAARAYDTIHDLLQDDAIDSIHNCTPNDLHVSITQEALAAGKHVLSEKPIATNAKDSRLLVESARSAHVIAGVCFNYRHFPLVRQARELVRTGALGPVHLVHGSYLQDWLLYPSDWNWRVDPRSGGASRAVADIGSHWIDLVQYVCGERVTAVCADLATLHAVRFRPAERRQTFVFDGDGAAPAEPFDVTTEDFATVLLRFESGARGSLVISQTSAGRKNRLMLQIDGADAALAWNQERPNHLWVGRRQSPNDELLRDPALLAPPAAALTRLPGGHQEGWADALHNLVVDFYAAVAAHAKGDRHEASFATFDDAHRLVEVVEAIRASSEEEAWQALPTPTPVTA